ncbi:hypothetical protein BX600DRAFT_467935 [Xylariales sp. PMI_506]|nr:hypothetical protein BX600DRAFT_467935 [Xylariales sp. PMI_506]
MASKRTVLITGCSDGSLGSALALAFHKAGWRVFASARNLSKLKLVEAVGIETLELDTLSDTSIASSVSEIARLTGGSLDALLNNAGAGHSMPLMDLDIDQAKQLFDLNVFSLITMSRAFFPLLVKSSRGAMLINNTSCSGTIAGGLPFAGAYNASKAAAASFTEGLRLELEPFGIKVVNLMTGAVRSTFHNNAPQNVLPPTSIYNIAKGAVERAMGGGDAAAAGSDPTQWAEQVVAELSRSNPSAWVWKGEWSRLVRFASLLPIGTFDSTTKDMVGLSIVEKKIKEYGGPSKVVEKTAAQ